jgi:hypothetical protein
MLHTLLRDASEISIELSQKGWNQEQDDPVPFIRIVNSQSKSHSGKDGGS